MELSVLVNTKGLGREGGYKERKEVKREIEMEGKRKEVKREDEMEGKRKRANKKLKNIIIKRTDEELTMKQIQ